MGPGRVPVLGAASFPSPLRLSTRAAFVGEDVLVLRDVEVPRVTGGGGGPRSFEKAGPRARIFFDPKKTTVGIVSAGGICPGINDVIRAIVLELRYGYGIERILGFRYGFAGLDPSCGYAPMPLEPDAVRDIHMRGGTILGTSRGPRDPRVMVDTLVKEGVDALIVIGGDGTMHAAHAIAQECKERGLVIGVVGVPKTIDNDIAFVDKTFGFETAVATARLAIDAAHAEAASVDNGVGLVKLMGRNAGFIAAHATLSSHDVNACLVPEVPFELRGERGFFAWLERRLVERRHAVVVVAEGCAARFAETTNGKPTLDPSGNVRYAAPEQDVGQRLKAAIEEHFAKRLTLKYIDPSYMIRAMRATGEDAVFCDAIARNAVHAALAGKTDLMVGRWHRVFTHVQLARVLEHDKRIDPMGDLWREVVESTGQPAFR